MRSEGEREDGRRRAGGEGRASQVLGWATRGSRPVQEGSNGPSEQAAEWAAWCSCGQAIGIGRRSRPAREKEKEKGLGWFSWAKMEEDEFFKVKSFSKSISSISQI